MGKKRVILLATLLLVAAGAATTAYAMKNVVCDDHTPPKITMDKDTLEVSVSYTREDLLRGVTAMDETDADVTGEIVVEGISAITSEHKAEITYAAFDRSGNVSKARRKLIFTDYEPPRFQQKKPLLLPEGTTEDVLDFMTAQDMVDGDISRRIKGNLVSDTTSLSHSGIHQVEFRVTNSMGDTARITLPVDVYPANSFNATVELSDYLIYIPRDKAFHGENYLENLLVGSVSYAMDGSDEDVQVLVNKNDTEAAEHVIRVKMNDDVNTHVPGIYSVTYTVTMDDQYTGFARLNVVVED